MGIDSKEERIGMSDEVQILELSLRLMSNHLDELIASCIDESGKPKAPDMRSVMRARGVLPPYCAMSLSKAKSKIG